MSPRPMRIVERLRSDPGLALLVLAMALAAALYAPTLGRGLVNYDDPWLLRDNWIVQDLSWASLRTIWFDLDSPRRFVLTPEYLPVRDMSVMLDYAVWGERYAGFHLTNVCLYLASIALWFGALAALGIERKVAGLCVLLWAVHPSHAESVAWLSERKGLLAMAFAGACALGYARFRAGQGTRWLVLAAVAAVCAVWSKAPGAFAVAALAALEWIAPAARRSWRRSLIGLGVIAAVAGLAFVPVLVLASSARVVGSEVNAPDGRLAMVVGVHGFYLRGAALALRNAVSYPIATVGPSLLDLVLGALGLAAMLALALAPRRGWWRPPREARAGATIWLVGWLPIGHLILPLQMVLVADRYLLFPTLGFALLAAAALSRIPRGIAQRALLAAVVVAAAARTFDAQANWRDPTTLWQRATASNPGDGSAWAMYVEALADEHRRGADPALVDAILEQALLRTRSPRLVMHQALLVLGRDRARGLALMREAAERGDPTAASNYALLLLDEARLDDALRWARAGAAARGNAHAHRSLGKVALAAARVEEAHRAFERAYTLEPHSCANRINMALVLLELDRAADAIPHLEACVNDPALGAGAGGLLRRARGAPPPSTN